MKLIFLLLLLCFQCIGTTVNSKHVIKKAADTEKVVADNPLNFGCIYLMKY